MTRLADFYDSQYLPHARANMKPKTVAEYSRLFESTIRPALGSKTLAKLSTQDIELWSLKLRLKTPTQANRALATVSSILRLARRWGLVERNAAHGIPKAPERPRERYLTKEEIQRVTAAADLLTADDRAFLLLAIYTGARPGELLGARWEWFKDGNLELPDSKTGRRTIYLPEPAREALSALKADGVGPVFPRTDARAVWRRVRRLAGLKDARLYDLRHTFASAGLTAGLPLEAVSQLLGHRYAQTSRRYTHLMPETGNAAAARTAEALQSMVG